MLDYALVAAAALAAADDHTEIDMLGRRGLAIQVAGTFSGTLTFKATVNGTAYHEIGLAPVDGGAVASTATAAGIWVLDINPGYTKIQVYWTARTSGAVTITALATD